MSTAATLPRHPGSQLFWEMREGGIWHYSRNRGWSGSRTRISGASARSGFEGYAFASDPKLGELHHLARCAAAGEPMRRHEEPRARHHHPPRGEQPSWLEHLVHRLGEGRPDVEIEAGWVAFDQTVGIARTGDGGPRFDRRSGGRFWIQGATGEWRVLFERALRHEGRHPEARLDAWAAEFQERVGARETARPARPGPTVCVFAPGVGGVVVHELIGHALEADTVLDGESRLAELSTPFDSDLVVIEDPRRGRAPWKIDDEGTPCRATALLRNGRIVSGLHDLRSAHRAGATSNGHGRRFSYRDPVQPRMGCTFLSAGAARPAQALAGVDQGIYVRRLEAASTDPRAGVTTVRVAEADAIRAGSMAESLQPFLLKTDVEDLVNRVDCIADDLRFDRCVGSCLREGQPLAISVGAPTFRLGLSRVIC